MIVVPFNSDFGLIFHKWFHDPRLKTFFRNFVNGCSLQQAQNAPAFMRANLLVGCIENEKGIVPVGLASFADTDTILRVYKTGVMIDPEYHHQKLGFKLSQLGLQWAFDTMNAHKVICGFLQRDEHLASSAERFGFLKEGRARKSVYIDGNLEDEIFVSLLQTEFNARTR